MKPWSQSEIDLLRQDVLPPGRSTLAAVAASLSVSRERARQYLNAYYAEVGKRYLALNHMMTDT